VRIIAKSIGLAALGALYVCGGAADSLAGGALDEVAIFSIRDPNASFIDLQARRAELGAAGVAALRALLPPAAGCESANRPVPPRGRMKLPGRYLSGSHGAVDPAYTAAEKLYVKMWDAVSRAASRYAAFGEPEDAICVLNILDDWAGAGALLDYSAKESQQAWFVAEWSGAAAGLALSVVRSEPGLPLEQLRRVVGWLGRVAHKQISEPTGPTSCCNNHAAWRGLMAAAIGVVAKDDSLFRYGVGRYLDTLEQITADGSLPLEMARHESALHYQSFTLLPMVGIAELAQRQGYDLYARQSRSGRTIHDAVRFLLDALDDPALVERHAGVRQDLKSFKAGGRNLAWMEAYRRRFPSPRFERWLTTAPFEPLLGGASRVYWRTLP